MGEVRLPQRRRQQRPHVGWVDADVGVNGYESADVGCEAAPYDTAAPTLTSLLVT